MNYDEELLFRFSRDIGNLPLDSTEYREGGTITVKGNTGSLARESKIFIGWATEEAATEPLYNEGATFEIPRSLTLYAVWGSSAYTISFDKNHTEAGGSQEDLTNQNWGDSVTLPPSLSPRLPV